MAQGYLLDSNAIIAATALNEDLILLTRNVDDFKNISDLELLNPWDAQV
jgi:predicted nucleic acid-binding protein